MQIPIPILPPIPAPDAIYKNDLGKTLAAQNQYNLTVPPTEGLPPTGELPPVPLYFPPHVFGDGNPTLTPPPELFGQNVNNLII